MSAAPPAIERLQRIRTFSELVDYLRDELEWPINEGMAEDEAFFEYDAAEVGLDEASAVKIERIRRLRPLVAGQPWGIFFIDFRPGKLPITVLRRILRALVLKKRASSDRQRWQTGDLLFISTLGESGDRSINLAHFSEEGNGTGRATLRVVDWDEEDSHFHMLRTTEELNSLRWPENPNDLDAWREDWASAFRLKPGQVARTAAQLAAQMAGLAKLIRSRVNAAMEIESPDGPLRRMYQAFKQVLVSDLTEDGFADMYAQTITYGLFAARRSRPMGVTADTARDMVPNTNPFLRDLLAEFTDVSGATKSLDFDELGIDALVEVLNQADMDAVISDFDDKNPAEDPVIHFYEDFLRQYDVHMKVQRGIFFTPRPVVSFIVRSVDELLRTEFGLEDGLADTTAWGEMIERHPGLTLPQGTSPDSPFVQVLDPAVGTGTFLVEVIDVIWATMRDKWRREGHMPLEFEMLWNKYVPTHLLPRLYGFELMMAPYAIAHMKIGLKLSSTGYRFRSEERLRIYLTNTLEPAADAFDQRQFQGWAPALAHEAKAANDVKRDQRFTILVGNPPYSAISANLGPRIRPIVDPYRFVDGQKIHERSMLQFEKNIQDDYIKFLAYSQAKLEESACGVCALVTNHSYLDGPTLRGVRWNLITQFPRAWFLDLHGNANKGERSPDGAEDKNVFDIRQGVCIAILMKDPSRQVCIRVGELWGTRARKYGLLSAKTVLTAAFEDLEPGAPYYYLVRPDVRESSQDWQSWPSIIDIFTKRSTGTETGFDGLLVGFTRDEISSHVMRFSDPDALPDEIAETFNVSAGHAAELLARRDELRTTLPGEFKLFQIRAYDYRIALLRKNLLKTNSFNVMTDLAPNALGLVTTRQTKENFAAFAVNSFCGHKVTSSYDRSYVFPLFTSGKDAFTSTKTPAINPEVLRQLQDAALDQEFNEHDLANDLFDYALAVMNSPSYAALFSPQLKRDWPRLPITESRELFHALAGLGRELASMHLLNSPRLDRVATCYTGTANPKVERIHYAENTVWLDKEQTQGFQNVPESIWQVCLGGYQICEKWLKDRKGRTLSAEDIEHYQKIVVAISETIRIMGEIDAVIDEHGGWPGAFVTSADAGASTEPEVS